MEPAKIDWKNLEWRFVEDDLYEHIKAPKWFDFLAQDEDEDDEAWFCRGDCNHPKTPQDFFNSEISPFAQRNQRDPKLKKRREVGENQNPNLLPGGRRDILSHISEFCNELKRMATTTKQGSGLSFKNEPIEKENSNSHSHLSSKNYSSRLLQIRTNPPSPQCFSAAKKPSKSGTVKCNEQPGILQERNKQVEREANSDKTLDVFWFLKPCTYNNVA